MVIITIRKIWIRKLGLLSFGTLVMYAVGLGVGVLFEIKQYCFDFSTPVELGDGVSIIIFIIVIIFTLGLFAGSVWCFILALFGEPPSISLKKYINIKIED